MKYRIDKPGTERHDVFNVTQLAPGTFLEELLGADYIRIDANTQSEIHRHNKSENIIFVLSGSATLILDENEIKVSEGDRVYIGAGVHHGFRTLEQALGFVSIQVPPILDKKLGIFDREVKRPGQRD